MIKSWINMFFLPFFLNILSDIVFDHVLDHCCFIYLPRQAMPGKTLQYLIKIHTMNKASGKKGGLRVWLCEWYKLCKCTVHTKSIQPGSSYWNWQIEKLVVFILLHAYRINGRRAMESQCLTMKHESANTQIELAMCFCLEWFRISLGELLRG